jgi:hypothetical protein
MLTRTRRTTLCGRHFSPEYTARRRYNEEFPLRERDDSDPSQRQLTFCEFRHARRCRWRWARERRRIVKIGRTIYENDYADHVPFAAICPAIMPYRFYGLSIADLCRHPALKSIHLARDARLAFPLAQSAHRRDGKHGEPRRPARIAPGGVVRFKTKPSWRWAPLEHRFVGQQAFPMIEYMDSVKENRTGFTRYSQGWTPTFAEQDGDRRIAHHRSSQKR